MKGLEGEKYKAVSWTGIVGGTITPERRLDCIILSGSVVELLNDGDKNLRSFSMRSFDYKLWQGKDPLVVVEIPRDYPANPKDYTIGRKLEVSGSFTYEDNRNSKSIGVIRANKIEFLSR